ncbi:MAG TPA: SDR family oxidoreductase [Acidimicrobiia bacterium]|jgi:NAD(P)-dependent dehydrogenase (short-subunit alcohol dehydrogenase family)
MDDRVAVVTGGASGMGAELVALLRDCGVTTVAWDVATGADIECDVSDAAAVDRALAQTVAAYGVPTVVTTCAAIGGGATPLLDVDPADWNHLFGVNVIGTWLVLRAAARALVEHELAGSLVAFSSISARLSDRGMGPYCASKAAVDMLVKVAASEWGRYGIRVNAIAPGVTDTPMLGGAARIPGWIDAVSDRTPLGGIGAAHDVARAALALHQLDWVTGESIAVDGGLRLHSPIDSFGAIETARERHAARTKDSAP